MGYGARPVGGGPDYDVIAAIASDPEGYKSRKKELESAIAAAQAASAEAAQRRAGLFEKEQALNAQASDLDRLAGQLAERAEALAKLDAEHLAQVLADKAAAAERDRVLNVKDRELTARDEAISKAQDETDELLRHAQEDRAAAAEILVNARSVVDAFEPVRAKLASLG